MIRITLSEQEIKDIAEALDDPGDGQRSVLVVQSCGRSCSATRYRDPVSPGLQPKPQPDRANVEADKTTLPDQPLSQGFYHLLQSNRPMPRRPIRTAKTRTKKPEVSQFPVLQLSQNLMRGSIFGKSFQPHPIWPLPSLRLVHRQRSHRCGLQNRRWSPPQTIRNVLESNRSRRHPESPMPSLWSTFRCNLEGTPPTST